MSQFTRREAVAISVGAPLLLGAKPASAKTTTYKGNPEMSIERYDMTPAVPGIPRISFAVAHGGLVYTSGVTANPGNLGDVAQQTTQVLARIDELLAKAGTDKSKLLTSQVWLTDMAHFGAHNHAWNAWVDHENPPARACLHSPQLWRPDLLVEIMVTAAH